MAVVTDTSARSQDANIVASPDPTTRFLNVDLDVEGPEPLGPLTQALLPIAFALHEEDSEHEGRETYELSDPDPHTEADPNAIIRHFCDALADLPERARRLWQNATTRDFNVGFDSGLTPHCSQWSIEADTVSKVAALGGRIVVTVYAVDQTGDAP